MLSTFALHDGVRGSFPRKSRYPRTLLSTPQTDYNAGPA
ncbi:MULTISPECIES: hypothetical protein [Marinobacter]|uniref:Uncharacterized protein n=1 Tax=Marinobacter suaedae TaxID=3057675 RepID=A0ABT8W137_9GAMM|nr:MULTISPECIES: hypothetical protein [unclassified Marinobacter]MDO3721962.1 hypothetical protein [Marinobacter sp. chi1]